MAQTKERHAEYMREWYAKRRASWIKAQGGKCALCGSSDDLEVDHIDPSMKQFNPGSIWMRTDAVREAELAKCQVLCGDCHAAKTKAAVEVPHGGGVSGKGKCKCDPCRIKKNEYLKLLKRERRARGLKD